MPVDGHLHPVVQRFAELIDAKFREIDPDGTCSHRDLDDLEGRVMTCLENMMLRINPENSSDLTEAYVTIATHMMMLIDQAIIGKTRQSTIPE